MKGPRGHGGTKAVSNGGLVGATAAAQVKGEGRDRSLPREQRSLPQGLHGVWEKRGKRGETGAEGEKGRESE